RRGGKHPPCPQKMDDDDPQKAGENVTQCASKSFCSILFFSFLKSGPVQTPTAPRPPEGGRSSLTLLSSQLAPVSRVGTLSLGGQMGPGMLRAPVFYLVRANSLIRPNDAINGMALK